MSAEVMTVIVSIVGGFISILLLANAFFVKDLVKTINEMRIELVRISTEYKNTVDDVKDLKEKALIQDKEIIKIRERLHNLEGYTPAIESALSKL